MEVYYVFPTAMTVEAFVTLHYDTRGTRDMEILSRGSGVSTEGMGSCFFLVSSCLVFGPCYF